MISPLFHRSPFLHSYIPCFFGCSVSRSGVSAFPLRVYASLRLVVVVSSTMWFPVSRVVSTARPVLIRRLAVGPGNDFGDTWLWCPLEGLMKNQMPPKSELGKRTRKERKKECVTALASTRLYRWCIDLTLSLCLQTHFVSGHKVTSRLRKQYTIIDTHSIVQFWSRWIEDLVYDDE